MSHSGPERYRAYELCLGANDFEYVGSLWQGGASTFSSEPGVYALTAPEGIKLYQPSWVTALTPSGWATRLERTTGDPDQCIVPQEIFYIGASKCLLSRIRNHRAQSKKAFKMTDPLVTQILREARDQCVPINVFSRRFGNKLLRVDELPLDLLHGAEAGLIRELRPYGNLQFKW